MIIGLGLGLGLGLELGLESKYLIYNTLSRIWTKISFLHLENSHSINTVSLIPVLCTHHLYVRFGLNTEDFDPRADSQAAERA
jgi:hypothetical protein